MNVVLSHLVYGARADELQIKTHALLIINNLPYSSQYTCRIYMRLAFRVQRERLQAIQDGPKKTTAFWWPGHANWLCQMWKKNMFLTTRFYQQKRVFITEWRRSAVWQVITM